MLRLLAGLLQDQKREASVLAQARHAFHQPLVELVRAPGHALLITRRQQQVQGHQRDRDEFPFEMLEARKFGGAARPIGFGERMLVLGSRRRSQRAPEAQDRVVPEWLDEVCGATGLQDAPDLLQGFVDLEVVQDSVADDQVELVVGERRVVGIRDQEGGSVRQAALGSRPLCLLDLGLRDVEASDVACAAVGRPEGAVAASASIVEDVQTLRVEVLAQFVVARKGADAPTDQVSNPVVAAAGPVIPERLFPRDNCGARMVGQRRLS